MRHAYCTTPVIVALSYPCNGIRFTHHILSDPDDDAPEFFSDDDQDPSVIVKLTDEERHELERAE